VYEGLCTFYLTTGLILLQAQPVLHIPCALYIATGTASVAHTLCPLYCYRHSQFCTYLVPFILLQAQPVLHIPCAL